MPRAILTFRLPAEQLEHDDAVHGSEWRAIVEHLYETARANAAHSEDDAEALQWGAIRDEIAKAVEDRDLQMWVW